MPAALHIYFVNWISKLNFVKVIKKQQNKI